MDILLDKKTPTEALIKITLKESDYQPKVEEKLKEYSRKASIKGFRPGKVPPALIKKMYGKSILADEINHLLSHSLSDYIKENNLKILGEPLPNIQESNQIDWDNQKEFEFIYDIGLVDDFQYTIDESIKVNKYEIDLDEKSLNETIENLKDQFAKTEEVETSEGDDQLFGELTISGAEFKKDVNFAIKEVDEKERKKFEGKKVEEVIEFDLKTAFPDQETRADILALSTEEEAQAEGEAIFTISKIKRVSPAEMNQEFFDKVFGKEAVDSEEAFLQKVKDTIQENYNRETESFLNHEIKEKILSGTEINTPDEFLKRWLLVTNEGKVSQEDVDKEYNLYLKELKWNLIQNKIMDENELKVEHEEVLEKSKDLIRKQFMAYGGSIEIEGFIDKYAEEYLKGDKGENYMKIFNQVKTDKILSFLKEKISIEDKKISLDEFKKVAMN